MRDERLLLKDILAAVGKIETFTSGMTISKDSLPAPVTNGMMSVKSGIHPPMSRGTGCGPGITGSRSSSITTNLSSK
jgi:hypothetical protein